MSELARATLQEIRSDRRGEPVGDALEVQFNPASLQVELSNTIEGGNSRSRQTRQYVGRSSTSLSFDLVFDTAEEVDEDGEPVSVRTRTALVEKYLLPRPEGNKEVPPKVRFQWGNLILDGIISELTMDFALFSPGGIPLRAEMGVTIAEQDPEYQFLESGPGANTPPADSGSPGDAPRPGEPGSSGSPSTDRSDQALGGESIADFATRQGLDPSRWRSMVPDGVDPLRLEAGTEIAFSTSVGLSAGLAVRAGVEANVSVPAEAALGLAPGSRPDASAGFELTAAGGVRAGLNSVASSRAEAASRAARAAFGSSVERTTSPAGGSAAPDARAVTYGFGVPLKARRLPDLPGSAPLSRGGRRGGSPWTALPAADPARQAADAAQASRGPTRSCGCRGRCGHGGGS